MKKSLFIAGLLTCPSPFASPPVFLTALEETWKIHHHNQENLKKTECPSPSSCACTPWKYLSSLSAPPPPNGFRPSGQGREEQILILFKEIYKRSHDQDTRLLEVERILRAQEKSKFLPQTVNTLVLNNWAPFLNLYRPSQTHPSEESLSQRRAFAERISHLQVLEGVEFAQPAPYLEGQARLELLYALAALGYKIFGQGLALRFRNQEFAHYCSPFKDPDLFSLRASWPLLNEERIPPEPHYISKNAQFEWTKKNGELKDIHDGATYLLRAIKQARPSCLEIIGCKDAPPELLKQSGIQGKSFFEAILRELRQISLKKVTLSNLAIKGISDTDESLFKELGRMKITEALDLSYNELNLEGTSEVSKKLLHLFKKAGPSKINLDHNLITDQGLENLAQALKVRLEAESDPAYQDSRLCEISLRHNTFSTQAPSFLKLKALGRAHQFKIFYRDEAP